MAGEFNLGALIDLDRDRDRVLITDLADSDQPRTWTGAELEAACQALARGLARRDLERGDRVAILSENRIEFVIAYLAVMRAGFVAVPVNHKLAPATVRYVLADANVRFVFADAARLTLCPPEIPAVCFDDADAYRALMDPGDHDPVQTSPDEVAMFLYTSGSTGQPKGVPLTHVGHLWVARKRIVPGQDYAYEQILVAAPL